MSDKPVPPRPGRAIRTEPIPQRERVRGLDDSEYARALEELETAKVELWKQSQRIAELEATQQRFQSIHPSFVESVPPPSNGRQRAAAAIIKALGGGTGIAAILAVITPLLVGIASTFVRISDMRNEIRVLSENIKKVEERLNKLDNAQREQADRFNKLVRSDESFRKAVGGILCTTVGCAPGLRPDDIEYHPSPLDAPRLHRVQPRVYVEPLPRAE